LENKERGKSGNGVSRNWLLLTRATSTDLLGRAAFDSVTVQQEKTGKYAKQAKRLKDAPALPSPCSRILRISRLNLSCLTALQGKPQVPWFKVLELLTVRLLGAAHKEVGKAWSFLKIIVPAVRQPHKRDTFRFQLLKDKLQGAEDRAGYYLLRAFRAGDEAGSLWELYMQQTEIEAAFKTLKSDLQLRPIRHHVELRIEAHILVCFLAYCLHVTLRKRLEAHAPGLARRAVLGTLSGILMLDVHLPWPTAGSWYCHARRNSSPNKRTQVGSLGRWNGS
jgi:hypothetical protein